MSKSYQELRSKFGRKIFLSPNLLLIQQRALTKVQRKRKSETGYKEG